MKKRIHKLVSFVLCAVMAASLSLTTLAADGTSATAVIEEPEYYGRAALSLLDNSEALLYAYDSIVKGVEELNTPIMIYKGATPLSTDSIRSVFDAYIRDYAQHFWIEYNYSAGWGNDNEGNYVYYINPSYTITLGEIPKARAKFDEAVNFMISEIDPNSSDFEKEKILHDRLAAAVTYVKTENSHNHNAYGALVEGKAVCDGYAEAYQYLLRKVGIQSFIALGTSTEPSTNKTVGHAWNYVRIDGNYYHADVTWDDQGQQLYHSYFNLTDERIREDHSLDKTDYKLPLCISYDKNYFTVYGGILNSPYSADEVAEILKNNRLIARLYINDDVEDIENIVEHVVNIFNDWFKNNFSKIIQALGEPGVYSAQISAVGREVILSVSKVSGGAVSGKIFSWDGTDNVIAKLYDGAVSDEEIRADMKFGTPQKALSNIFETSELSLRNNKYYQAFALQNIAAGNYKVAFFKPGGHVVDIKSVSVKDSLVTDINADMQKCGDINNDGNFNSLDLSGLRRALLNASEKIQACDSDQSGTIDIIDLIRLKKIVSLTV